MKISIKRGTKEIGGTAIEITANSGKRIILDLGLPLDSATSSPNLLPDIKGLTNKSDDLSALLISHAHQDHYGLGNFIDKSLPVYISQEAQNMMKIAEAHHLPQAFVFSNPLFFQNKKPFFIDDFKITPYLCDHSAYGAYSFLIEANNQKIFYSGDFRAHGRKGKLFSELLKNAPQDIDILLLEGSCLGREQSEHYETEIELENKFYNFWKETSGLAMVQASAQNIDRIVTIYRAAKRCNRTLILSGYAGHILWETHNPHLPNFTWDNVKKFTKQSIQPHETDLPTILKNPQKYIILLDYRISQQLKASGALNHEASYVYSMWDGYKEKYQDWLSFLAASGVKMQDIHTSGHADIPTLKEMVSGLKPRTIIPIHTFYPQEFKLLFDDVLCLNDGDILDISTL